MMQFHTKYSSFCGVDAHAAGDRLYYWATQGYFWCREEKWWALLKFLFKWKWSNLCWVQKIQRVSRLFHRFCYMKSSHLILDAATKTKSTALSFIQMPTFSNRYNVSSEGESSIKFCSQKHKVDVAVNHCVFLHLLPPIHLCFYPF